MFEQLQRLRVEPGAQFLRLGDPMAGQHRAGDQPVAHVGVEIGGALAQTVGMQLGAFNHGDQIGRGAGAMRLRQLGD